MVKSALISILPYYYIICVNTILSKNSVFKVPLQMNPETVVVSDYWERQTFIFVEYSFVYVFTYSSPDSFNALQLGKQLNNVTEFVNIFLQIQMGKNKLQVEKKFDKTTSTQGPLTTGAFNHHMFHNGANFILWWRPCASGERVRTSRVMRWSL